MANLNGISTPESKIWDLERLIHVDPGNRGLKGIWEELEALHRFPSLYNLGYSASTLYSGCKKALVVWKGLCSSEFSSYAFYAKSARISLSNHP